MAGGPAQPRGGASPDGRLAANIMHFARVLRRAGLPVGPGSVIAAIEAVEAVGIGSREDFYWTLHASLVMRHEEREVFDQAFHVFWRNPKLLHDLAGLDLADFARGLPSRPAPGAARVTRAMVPHGEPGAIDREERIETDARFSFSETELLQDKDFEQMTSEELAAARAALRNFDLPMARRRTRRFRATDERGLIDMRRTLRSTLRQGGDLIALRRRIARTEPHPLVILCDVSGSMGEYTRLFLHFLHALMAVRRRVHVFVFATRLTNITRQLRDRDVDMALEQVSGVVEDWSGGTRIGACLATFNRVWSRRVLGSGAVVILVSDGLERVSDGVLDHEAARLRRSCTRLIWLNPLLRYDRFEPRASGIRTLLGHVDELRPVHNLDSVGKLVDALSAPRARGHRAGALEGVH